MTYKVFVTNQAKQDINNIYQYIKVILKAQDSASDQVERILKAIQSLSQLPNRHKVFEDGSRTGEQYRMLPVDNYMIFYIVNDTRNEVYVVRVMYKNREHKRHLR